MQYLWVFFVATTAWCVCEKNNKKKPKINLPTNKIGLSYIRPVYYIGCLFCMFYYL